MRLPKKKLQSRIQKKACKIYMKTMTHEEIARATDLSLEEIRELAAQMETKQIFG